MNGVNLLVSGATARAETSLLPLEDSTFFSSLGRDVCVGFQRDESDAFLEGPLIFSARIDRDLNTFSSFGFCGAFCVPVMCFLLLLRFFALASLGGSQLETTEESSVRSNG